MKQLGIGDWGLGVGVWGMGKRTITQNPNSQAVFAIAKPPIYCIQIITKNII